MSSRRLGVLGWPVAHSRSPAIHNAAFAALGMEGWRYQRLPVPPELFEETVPALPSAGFVGANVTIPHKQVALRIADDASATAREVGAANTLIFLDSGEVRAENTDAPGILSALRVGVLGKEAVVLGAGGSARAAVWALLSAGAKVYVWNRTSRRAKELAEELGAEAVEKPPLADLLLNCTSVGLQRSASELAALNQMQLTADQVGRYPYVIDLVYSDAPTPLLRAAARAGCETVDGLEILVRQGALSFEMWTGVRPPLDVMLEAARSAGQVMPDAARSAGQVIPDAARSAS